MLSSKEMWSEILVLSIIIQVGIFLPSIHGGYLMEKVAIKLMAQDHIHQSSLNRNMNLTGSNESGLSYGNPCHFYGIDGKVPVGFNIASLTGAGRVCKVSQRLECVPRPWERASSKDGEDVSGRCACIRALSSRAVFLTPKGEGTKDYPTGCYIPAGFSESSTCGHVIPLPYGMYQTAKNLTKVGDNVTTLKWIGHYNIGNSADLCVPNSKCRTSSKFVGIRCVCNRLTDWNEKDGTCVSVWDPHAALNSGTYLSLPTLCLSLAAAVMLLAWINYLKQ